MKNYIFNLEQMRKDVYFCKKVEEYQELNKKVEELDKQILKGNAELKVYEKREEADMQRNVVARFITENVVEQLFSDINSL